MHCTSLASITIPNSVTSIGISAFESCESLNNIIFDGTIEEWDAIDFGNNWNSGVPCANIFFNVS